MTTVSQPRRLTEDEKRFFMELKPSDIKKSFLQNLFSDIFDATNGKVTKAKYNTFDEFELKKGEYYNSDTIITTCGIFLLNKRIFEENYLERIGYQNKEFSNSQFKKFNVMLVEFAKKSKEEYIKYIQFLDEIRWLGDVIIDTQICSSISLKSAKPLPKVQKRKAELLKKYEKDIVGKNIEVVDKINKELLTLAEKELEDDPSLELYQSGARGSFDNAYRRMQIMMGPIFNASTGEYDILTNSLYDGYTKEQLNTTANEVVSVFYPKAIGSGDAGYLSKEINAAFQTVELDEEGTDCGTKQTRSILLTDDMIKLYTDSYMVEGSKFVKLTPENKSKYAGKVVKMRTVDYCIGDKPCSICAGSKMYDMGLRNQGLTLNKISGSFLNGKMKGSHDTTVRLQSLTEKDMIE